MRGLLKGSRRIPFQERKNPWRGILDLATGRYPGFLFGGSIRGCVPVFHFHEVTRHYLEPYFSYLRDNGYHTITSRALTSWIKEGTHPGNKAVMLCFDDAWASMWTVVLPLLQEYEFSAVTYPITSRIEDADHVREPEKYSADIELMADRSTTPFATWPELTAMHESGLVDIQAHTHTHRMIPCAPVITGLKGAGHHQSLLSGTADQNKPDGTPLLLSRSRMSDALQFLIDQDYVHNCIEFVEKQGHTDFLQQSNTIEILLKELGPPRGHYETKDEANAEIRKEVELPKTLLKERMPGLNIHQICLPWAVCGKRAEQIIKDAGYTTAIADQLFGCRSPRRNTSPFRIMRLKHQFIYCLPGRGRKFFWSRWSKI